MSGYASPTLDRVARGRLCSGCGLCASLGGDAVTMALLPPGFARPVQAGALDAATEQAIAATCPGSRVAPWRGPTVDPIWGPYLDVRTGNATDPRIRYAGSSGGVLSALAVHALETGMADRIVHVAMDEASPTLSRIQRSVAPEQVIEAAGSRYAPASPLAGIVAELERGGRFVFIGKPCDVGALRQLATIDPRVDACVPLMLSFFCAGTPSQAGTDRILAHLGADNARLNSFRYRGDGWPGYATATETDGRVTRMSYADSWGDILSKEVQFRCKICPDAVGGVADVACADAWYGDDSGYPQFEEAEGRSLVIVRNDTGRRVLDDAIAAGRIETQPLAIGEIVKMQPHQARRKRLVASRLAAAAVLGQPRPDMTGLCVGAAARQAGAGDQFRNFLGAARRIVRQRTRRSAAEVSN